ncbi:MAG: hypothetical protein ACXVSL_08775 [Solirubrobacteraceae bacterium]
MHVRRVVMAVPERARAVAWLHEALQHTSISEQALLTEGLSAAELRALRLLIKAGASQSDISYLTHIELIAQARGPGVELARCVERADLTDRLRHPVLRSGGWSPPRAAALRLLRDATSAVSPATTLRSAGA